MNKKRKIPIIFILIITSSLIFFKIHTNNKQVKMPTIKNISRFEVLHIINEELIERKTISKRQDLTEFLDILNQAKKADIENISTYSNDRPNRDNYIILNTKISNGQGYTTNYIYKENSSYYFEQPFYGLFKINSDKLKESNPIKTFLK